MQQNLSKKLTKRDYRPIIIPHKLMHDPHRYVVVGAGITSAMIDGWLVREPDWDEAGEIKPHTTNIGSK